MNPSWRTREKGRRKAAIKSVGHEKPRWNKLKVSHVCQLGQAAVGHFHKAPMEQVIGGCWLEQDRGSGADGPVLHWPRIPAPCWGPQEEAEQAPRKNGVPLSPWHCTLPSLGLHPSLYPLPLQPSLSHPSPPSPPHLTKHPKRWPSPQGSGQPPGLTMAQTTSWSKGRPCQMGVPGMDACRKCNSIALMQLCFQARSIPGFYPPDIWSKCRAGLHIESLIWCM